MKNILVVTGGAGFVGSNLISYLLKKTKYQIISIDNYSTGTKKNHIKNSRIDYIKSNTRNISKILKLKKKNIHSIFHFGEFSRIYQSFLNLGDCLDSNTNFLTINLGANANFVFQKLLSLGVILRPLQNYGLKNYLRVTIGKKTECNTFIKKLKKVLSLIK